MGDLTSDQALDSLRAKLDGKPYCLPGSILAMPRSVSVAYVTPNGVVRYADGREVTDGVAWLFKQGYVVIREGWGDK